MTGARPAAAWSFSAAISARLPSGDPPAAGEVESAPGGATLRLMSDQAPAPSRKAAVKIVATVLGIGGAIALLLTASISKGAEYYKFVDEVMSNTDSFRGKKLQVHGVVVDGSIEQARGTLMYRFKIKS